jgi:hypothetical protein
MAKKCPKYEDTVLVLPEIISSLAGSFGPVFWPGLSLQSRDVSEVK